MYIPSLPWSWEANLVYIPLFSWSWEAYRCIYTTVLMVLGGIPGYIYTCSHGPGRHTGYTQPGIYHQCTTNTRVYTTGVLPTPGLYTVLAIHTRVIHRLSYTSPGYIPPGVHIPPGYIPPGVHIPPGLYLRLWEKPTRVIPPSLGEIGENEAQRGYLSP